jgi:type IX secretion system PorP/SprF family membrane protein
VLRTKKMNGIRDIFKRLPMLKRTFVLPFLLFLLTHFQGNLYAQDPMFSQFYGNPLYLSPALAGREACSRAVLNYRNQWPGLDGSVYATYSASYDQFVSAFNGGVGVLVLHDVAGQGALTTDNVSLMYSYHLPVNRKFVLKLGLQGTWFQKSVDWGKLTFGDMIDRRSGFVYNTLETQKIQNKQGWDFSTGVFGYTKSFYGGFVAKHLTQPDEGLLTISKLPLKIMGHFGAMIPVGDKRNELSISPNILYQNQGAFQELNIGLYMKKSAIVSGFWYRNRDAVILLLGIQIDNFRIGYSYDVTVSKLTNASLGAHEVSLTLKFACKQKPGRSHYKLADSYIF